MDYSDKDARARLIEMANQTVGAIYAGSMPGRLREPPPCNPYNTVLVAMANAKYRDWARHWFRVAEMFGPCNVGNIELSCYNPLAKTGDVSCHFTWTYDPDITFNAPGGAYTLDTDPLADGDRNHAMFTKLFEAAREAGAGPELLEKLRRVLLAPVSADEVISRTEEMRNEWPEIQAELIRLGIELP